MIGLNNREYRDRTASVRATRVNRSSIIGSGAGFNIGSAIGRRRRSLKATPLRTTPTAGTEGSAPSSSTGQRVNTQGFSDTKGANIGFGGIGIARPITGANMGFDGIGVPETRLVPEDLSLAVGNTGAIHTANSMIRFYRVDVSGRKVKKGVKDLTDSSTFLKQVWTADFFYAVGGGLGLCLR